MRALANVVGFDDAPFPRTHRGDVSVVGVVCSGTRIDGVLRAHVRRDGQNSTRVLAELVRRSPFDEHAQAVLLQGITLAGFNVVDIHGLADTLARPVLVVVRRRPDLSAVKHALLTRVPGGQRKWRLIERAGEPEALGGVYVQRAGLGREAAEALLSRTTAVGHIPEALRVAHLVAGASETGVSRGRA